jgi:hypothetical protein
MFQLHVTRLHAQLETAYPVPSGKCDDSTMTVSFQAPSEMLFTFFIHFNPELTASLNNTNKYTTSNYDFYLLGYNAMQSVEIQLLSRRLLACLILLIPPRFPLIFNGLHGVISQNIELITATTVRASDPTYQ